MVDLCVHVEANLLAVLQLLGNQFHLLLVIQLHGFVLPEFASVYAVVVAVGGQDVLLLLPKLLQYLTALLLVVVQPLNQSQQPLPECVDESSWEELELVAVFYDL